MRLQRALRLYLDANVRVTSPSTLKHYDITIRQYELVAGRHLRSLTDDNLARFMRFLADKGRAPATVNQKRNYVCALWRWCAKRGYISRWPTVQLVPEPDAIPEAWTLAELGRLFAACRRQRDLVAGVRAGDWWYSIHLWWYYSGERVSATLAARWEDYAGNSLLIHGRDRKEKRTILYDLVPVLTESIEQIREPPRALIWPWSRTVSSFYWHYNKLLKSAGLAHVPWKSGPHKMRRSHASHLAAAGGDATLSLRHSRSSLTRRSYLDPRIVRPPNQSLLLPKIG